MEQEQKKLSANHYKIDKNFEIISIFIVYFLFQLYRLHFLFWNERPYNKNTFDFTLTR